MAVFDEIGLNESLGKFKGDANAGNILKRNGGAIFAFRVDDGNSAWESGVGFVMIGND